MLLTTAVWRAWLSFDWINTHDTGLMHYMAWLMDVHGYVPWRDVLDTSFPGSYLIHLWSGQLFGFDSTGFRVADIAALCLLLLLAWHLLQPAGALVAFSAISIYALHYYANHSSLHFQRDYLALLPICAGLLLAQRSARFSHLALVGSGFCFAMAAAIKPQLAAGLPVAWLYAAMLESPAISFRRLSQLAAWMAMGFISCIVLIILWLYRIDAWPSFVEMTRNYLPIYLLPDESHRYSSSLESFIYFLSHEAWHALISLIKSSLLYLVPALAGCLWLWINNTDRTSRLLVLMLLAMMLAGMLSNFMGFRQWAYHAMPFAFFSLLCGALIFQPVSTANAPLWQKCYAVLFRCLFLLMLLFTQTIPQHLNFKGDSEGNAYQKKAADDLIVYMQQHATSQQVNLSNEYAQPITWNSVGPILPVLQSLNLRIPTRFPECWVCHHEPADDRRANAYRQELLAALEKNPPRFIFADRFYKRLSAENPASPFPALARWVDTHYRILYETDYLLVYERR